MDPAAVSAASMQRTSSRADSALNSTATRLPGPSSSLAKSMLSVCSYGAWNGWSKYTVADRRRNHPCGPLPLPATAVLCVRYEHMRPSLHAQVAIEPRPDALPTIGGGLGAITDAIRGEEAMPGSLIGMEGIGLLMRPERV